jgi:hypothetical protein
MIRVTFDSNVWRNIASPNQFPKDQLFQTYQKINEFIQKKKMLPCLAETVFTLEAVKKTNRRAFLESYEPEITTSAQETGDGQIKISMVIKPKANVHPGNNPYLSAHLQDALQIGFKLLHQPRLARVKNPDILEEWFLVDNDIPIEERQKKFECLLEIESRGCGISHIKNIGNNFSNGQHWLDGIKNAPTSEDVNIAKAVAEWADGDSVAAHIAYDNRYFCTKDQGKNTASNLILSKTNKQWLTSVYNVEFVTPIQLEERIIQE